MKRFILQLSGLTVLSALLVIGFHAIMEAPVSIWNWFALGFFFLLNLLVNFLSQTALKGSQKSFVTFVYGSTGIRFIFSIFFIVIYLMVSDIMDKMVIGVFLFLYLLFTSFELYHLVAKLRAEK